MDSLHTEMKREEKPIEKKEEIVGEIAVDRRIQVYVATCQKKEHFKFLLRNVWSNATVATVQYLLIEQWQIMKSTYLTVPLDEHIYTCHGKILQLDANMDTYYIKDGDTMYIRFKSFGDVTDPHGMSSDELRIELSKRNAYKKNLRPDQLMTLLEDELIKESRLVRLKQAIRRENQPQVISIRQELLDLEKRLQRRRRRASTHNQGENVNNADEMAIDPNELRSSSMVWSMPPTKKRTIFLSISELERMFLRLPRDVTESSVLLFDIERAWVFNHHDDLRKNRFDYKYMAFPPDFLEFLTLKEEANMLFWFRPDKSYEKLSQFISNIIDPVTEKKYHPLLLKLGTWLQLAGSHGWEGAKKENTTTKPKTKTETTTMKPKFTRYVVGMDKKQQNKT